jgi:RIO-like serine/threonine protein kinase
MKPANMMIDKDGTFYVIDFGQSVLLSEIPKGSEDQFATLQEDEIKIAKRAVRSFFFKYRELQTK